MTEKKLKSLVDMTALDEALELKKRAQSSLSALQRHDSFLNDCKESEVIFRFRALYGILIMACNDIDELVKYWKDQS
jgi:hypothetical protein